MVDYLNHTVSAQPPLFDVFLSHAHVDGEFVEELGVRLEGQANIQDQRHVIWTKTCIPHIMRLNLINVITKCTN